ncbi:MAG: VanZ family protein [Ruminococcus sp.]|nr:VanZ family protein [Ruminococcus sp.]
MNKTSKNFSSPRAVIFFILTIAVMTAIFLFSCENSGDSSETSGTIVEIVIDLRYDNFNELSPAEQQNIYDDISHIIRKTAHFTAFAALGFCVSMFLGRCKFFSAKKLGALVFCFLYACSDELHQYFVPGRACMFTDVLIDTSGSLTGMFISLIVFTLIADKDPVME